jgi:hypothetical protein
VGSGGLGGHTLLGHQGVVAERPPLLEEGRDTKVLAILDDVAHPGSAHRPATVTAFAANYQPVRLKGSRVVEAHRADRRFIGNESDNSGDAA